MPKHLSKSLERRALVALACYFLIVQAFLAGLTLGFSAAPVRAATGDAAICHRADVPAQRNEGKTGGWACGLCALAGAGILDAPAPAEAAPPQRVFTRFIASPYVASPPAAFDWRAGRARAPPGFALS
jgi:hypothetical protein